MGGERASTTRQRLAGTICCSCKIYLGFDPSHRKGERHCDRCAPRRRVYAHFMNCSRGWYVQFLEEHLRTSLPRTLTFATPAKIFELADRGGADLSPTARQAIAAAVDLGRGSIWLQLTSSQYAKLRPLPSR